jgi:hypothetical protein
MEADYPAVIVIAYMCIIAKPGNGGGLRIGMDPLRGVSWTLEALVKAVPFDPLKCIAGLNVQCKRDWCVGIYTLRTQEEQGLAPLLSEHTPSPFT